MGELYYPAVSRTTTSIAWSKTTKWDGHVCRRTDNGWSGVNDLRKAAGQGWSDKVTSWGPGYLEQPDRNQFRKLRFSKPRISHRSRDFIYHPQCKSLGHRDCQTPKGSSSIIFLLCSQNWIQFKDKLKVYHEYYDTIGMYPAQCEQNVLKFKYPIQFKKI